MLAVVIVSVDLVNIVNRSRPRLTSCLKQARHQCDVCTPSSDCLVVYNQFVFVTLKKCMAAMVNKFLRSCHENINNLKFESSWYEQYKRPSLFECLESYEQHPASRLETSARHAGTQSSVDLYRRPFTHSAPRE